MPAPHILYSANSWLAYRIAEQYYSREHHVWCSPFFNSSTIPEIDFVTPPTSNPCKIYCNLQDEVRKGDRHSAKIEGNKIGILRGATLKRQAGLISEEHERDIAAIVSKAETIDFRPLLYIIPFAVASDMLKEVPINERAHPLSVEYIIESLPRKNFDIIHFD
jgi:hypothetical protein